MSGEINLINNKLNKLSRINELNSMKFELYGIMTTVLLSKEYFKRNSDIKPFLNKFSINFKDYVFKSRTILLSRSIRYIEKLDFEEIQSFIEKLTYELPRIVTENSGVETDKSINGHKKGRKKENNYMEELLNKYSRNKGK